MERDHLNKIVGKEYDNFIMSMARAAEFDELPVSTEVTYPLGLTFADCKELAEWVKEDTGLDVEFQAYLCQNCGELHLHMIVDYPEEE